MQQPILQPKAVLGYANLHVDIASDFVERISQQTDGTSSIQDFLPEIYKYVTEGWYFNEFDFTRHIASTQRNSYI